LGARPWPRCLAALAALATLVLGLSAARPAMAGDGDIRWLSLTLPEADLHFPAQHQALAERAAAAWQDARQTLAPLFNARDRPRLQLTIDDYVDGANGYATPVPYDRLHLQAYPPEVLSDLADHGDWVRALVFHEYAHILHMGDVSGLPNLANRLMGRRFFPNAAMPRMLLEGIATWVETRHTGADHAVQGRGGRIGSAQFRALLRAAALENALPAGLDQLTGRPLLWPRGNAWYLYGSLLIDHLARTYGADRLREFMALYGQQVVPYGVQGLARQVWGASMERLWRDTVTEEKRAILGELRELTGTDLRNLSDPRLAELARQGDGERLSLDGEWRGRIRPGQTADSAVVAHTPRDGLARIEQFQADKAKAELLHTCELDCDEPLVTPDGRWLIFTESRNFRRVYLYRELVALALGSGPAKPLTLSHGLRGRSFAVDDRGEWLVGIAVRGASTAVVAVRLAQALQAGQAQRPLNPEDFQTLLPPTPLGTVVDSPLMVGKYLWWTESRGGQRLLRRAPLDRQSLAVGVAETLPAQLRPGQELAPEGTKTARPLTWVGDLQLFQMDGQPRLGALVDADSRRDAAWLDPAAPEQGWRLRTRSLTGLVSAAHLANRAMTVRHHSRGLDVWAGPADRPRSDQAVAVAGAGTVETAVDAPYTPPQAVASQLGPYRPWSTLRPRAWYPLFLTTGDGTDWRYGGSWLGVQVVGRDASDFAGFSALAQLRSDGQDPLLQLDLEATRWEPRWTLSSAYDQAFGYFRRGYQWYSTPTHRIGAKIGGEWRIPQLRSAWSFNGGLRTVYSWLRYDRYDQLISQDPGGLPPIDPSLGAEFLGDAAVSWHRAEAYAESIRTERLHSAVLRTTWGAKPSSGDKRWVVAAQTDHAWPLGRRQVLSWSLHGVLALEPGQRDALYRIQGVMPLTAPILGLFGPTGATVRGAPLETGLGGHALTWSSLAWHLPLADIGRTLDVLPVYAGRMRGSLFADAAWAAVQAGRLDPGALGSVGAEISLDLEIGYALGAVLQLGAAWVPGWGPGTWLNFGL
jgi:hypothetical protein